MIKRDRERLRQFKTFGQSSRPGTLESPTEEKRSQEAGEDWVVTVYNNETNTYEEVITILMIATACTPDEAYIEAWEIDHYGRCGVHRASKEVCEDVAAIIRAIGIRVEVEREQALSSSE
ncbi:MAG TPA: ATP-dependent Clp protease adaptor ClpS [Fimbriimonadaceae bacterium]|nr:ATP-dependent Clp protease adaptor ClpS [Fimbriimonadaceae bacterium]HRJ32154.1 ATP-dependent Clp protease adaptor ClpS [Fimbriimonadaceae bacterium]